MNMPEKIGYAMMVAIGAIIMVGGSALLVGAIVWLFTLAFHDRNYVVMFFTGSMLWVLTAFVLSFIGSQLPQPKES